MSLRFLTTYASLFILLQGFATGQTDEGIPVLEEKTVEENTSADFSQRLGVFGESYDHLNNFEFGLKSPQRVPQASRVLGRILASPRITQPDPSLTVPANIASVFRLLERNPNWRPNWPSEIFSAFPTPIFRQPVIFPTGTPALQQPLSTLSSLPGNDPVTQYYFDLPTAFSSSISGPLHDPTSVNRLPGTDLPHFMSSTLVPRPHILRPSLLPSEEFSVFATPVLSHSVKTPNMLLDMTTNVVADFTSPSYSSITPSTVLASPEEQRTVVLSLPNSSHSDIDGEDSVTAHLSSGNENGPELYSPEYFLGTDFRYPVNASNVSPTDDIPVLDTTHFATADEYEYENLPYNSEDPVATTIFVPSNEGKIMNTTESIDETSTRTPLWMLLTKDDLPRTTPIHDVRGGGNVLSVNNSPPVLRAPNLASVHNSTPNSLSSKNSSNFDYVVNNEIKLELPFSIVDDATSGNVRENVTSLRDDDKIYDAIALGNADSIAGEKDFYDLNSHLLPETSSEISRNNLTIEAGFSSLTNLSLVPSNVKDEENIIDHSDTSLEFFNSKLLNMTQLNNILPSATVLVETSYETPVLDDPRVTFSEPTNVISVHKSLPFAPSTISFHPDDFASGSSIDFHPPLLGGPTSSFTLSPTPVISQPFPSVESNLINFADVALLNNLVNDTSLSDGIDDTTVQADDVLTTKQVVLENPVPIFNVTESSGEPHDNLKYDITFNINGTDPDDLEPKFFHPSRPLGHPSTTPSYRNVVTPADEFDDLALQTSKDRDSLSSAASELEVSTTLSAGNETQSSLEVPVVRACIDFSVEFFCKQKHHFRRLFKEWVVTHKDLGNGTNEHEIEFYRGPSCSNPNDRSDFQNTCERGTDVLFYVKTNGHINLTLTEEYPLYPYNFEVSEHLKRLREKVTVKEVVGRRSSHKFSLPDSSTLSTGVVIAIVVAILLVVSLVIFRRRQAAKNFYGKRCTPVSIDAYSMDSVSVYHASFRRKSKKRGSNKSIKSYLNQGFDDPNGPSRPLNFAKLTHFISDIDGVHEEFTTIPVVMTKYDEMPLGIEEKNRYANVIPVPETIVPLKLLKEYSNSTYINANYVRGPRNESKYYIATQAPLDTTVGDFWRMIWEQECRLVVMLTDFVEKGIDKCADYLPPSETLDCHRMYGDFQVTLKSRDMREKYVISHVQLKNLENNLMREVSHLWFSSWPLSGVPNEEKSFISFILDMRRTKKQLRGKGPIVIHCSPGTGRTGTFIACDVVMKHFEENRGIDVPKTVYSIRRDRAGAVQTKEQYAFIYRVISTVLRLCLCTNERFPL